MSGSDILTAVRAELQRTNFTGRRVTLAEGVAVCAGTTWMAWRGAGPVHGLMLGAIGGLGIVDDLVEPRARRAGRTTPKGLRGHLGALRAGRPTTGAIKALGIPLIALGAVLADRGRRGPVMVVCDAALIAGSANLVNLLDLRPGRALKAVLPAAVLLLLLSAGPAGEVHSARRATGAALARAAALPAAAALPMDLRERGMLGDAGANILGAALGAAAAHRLPAAARLGLLTGVVALTVLSERISFSAVIERTPALRALDQLGRRTAPDAAASSGPAASPGAAA